MRRSLATRPTYWKGSESHNPLAKVVPLFRTGGHVLEPTPLTMRVMRAVAPTLAPSPPSGGEVRLVETVDREERAQRTEAELDG